MPPKPKPQQSQEAALGARAASRGYTIEKRDDQWYVTIGGTSYGPMQTLDEVDEFLPAE